MSSSLVMQRWPFRSFVCFLVSGSGPSLSILFFSGVRFLSTMFVLFRLFPSGVGVFLPFTVLEIWN